MTPVQAYINSLDTQQKIDLMHALALDVAKALPQSLIATQIVFHAGYLAGVTGKKEGKQK